MSTLAALLRCLGRSDITEVRLQSDSVAAAAFVAGGSTPLTKAPLTTAQINQILDGTSLCGVLASLADGSESQTEISVAQTSYGVRMMRHQSRLQVRFFRSTPSERPSSGASASASASASVDFASAPQKEPPHVSASASALRTAGVQTPKSNAAEKPAEDPVKQSTARRRLSAILLTARQQQASDVHLAANRSIMMRRYGELTAHGPSLDAGELQQMLYAIIAPEQIQALQTIGYVDLALDLPEAGRVRLNVCRQAGGLKGCFRLISNSVPTLAKLGLPKELEAITSYHQGLAIVAGPNGQGKTTTLAAIVNLINTDAPRHIITVEDPVEVLHPVKRAVMSQRQVGLHTKSFSRALKASLREDPDVIVIGELRDRETVEIALTAAETGHLVIATMSTRSAAKTIDRLIDLFPPDDQPQVRATLAGALKVIVSQRLLPSLDGAMVAVAEVITGSVPLWSLIRDNKLFQLPSLQTRGRSLGMIKFDTSLQELVHAKKISLEVAKKYAENPVEFERGLTVAVPAPPPSKRA